MKNQKGIREALQKHINRLSEIRKEKDKMWDDMRAETNTTWYSLDTLMELIKEKDIKKWEYYIKLYERLETEEKVLGNIGLSLAEQGFWKYSK